MTRVSVTCHDCDVKKMADDKDADAFMLFYFLTAKQHKKWTIWVRRWLLDRYAICWSYNSPADCLWKLNHALEVGRLYRSSDASLRNKDCHTNDPVKSLQESVVSLTFIRPSSRPVSLCARLNWQLSFSVQDHLSHRIVSHQQLETAEQLMWLGRL